MILTKVKFEEQAKGVCANVEVQSDVHTPQEVLKIAQELNNEALAYTRQQTMRKII